MYDHLLALLLSAVAAAEHVQQDGRREAEDAWEAVIAAKGGRDRLHAVRNIVRSIYVPRKTGSGRRFRLAEEFYLFPGKYWEWNNDLPKLIPPTSITLWDLERGIQYHRWSDDASARKSNPDLRASQWAMDMVQAVDLLETQWVVPKPLRVWTEGRGRKAREVIECELTIAGVRTTATYTLDPVTHLPMKIVVKGRGDPLGNVPDRISTVSGYTNVSGIQVPQTLASTIPGLDPWTFQMEYQINVDYDPDLFSRPPRTEDGPEGWRRK